MVAVPAVLLEGTSSVKQMSNPVSLPYNKQVFCSAIPKLLSQTFLIVPLDLHLLQMSVSLMGLS